MDLISKVADSIGTKIEGLLKKAEDGTTGLANNLLKGGSAAVVAGGALEAAAIGETTAMLKMADAAVNVGHAQYELAQLFGLSAKQAGLWGAAAEAVGVTTDSVGVGFKTLAKNMESLKLLDNASATKELLKEQQAEASMELRLSELKKIGNKHLVEQQQKLIENTKAHIANMQASLASADAARPLQAIFDQLGVVTTTSTGALRPMHDVMLDLATALSKLPDGAEKAAIAVKLFGRSGVDMLPLLDQGAAGIQKFMQAAEESGSVMDDTQVAAAQKAYLMHKQLDQAIGGVTLQIEESFIPVLVKLMGIVTPWLHSLADWVKHHQTLIGILVPTVIVVTALFGGLLMLAGVIAMLGAGLIMLPVVLPIVAAGFGMVMAAALPILLIMAGIVAVVLLVWFAFTHWKQITAIAGEVLGSVGDMVGKVGAYFGQLIASVVNTWTAFWKNPFYYVGLAVGFIIGSVIRIHDMVVKWLAQMVLDTLAFWLEMPKNAWDALLAVIAAIGKWAAQAAPAMGKGAQDMGASLINELKKLPAKALSIGADIARGILKGITSIPGEVKNAAGNFVGGLVAGIKASAGIKSPSKLFQLEVGLQLAQGVAAGITQGIPHVNKAFAKMMALEAHDVKSQAQSVAPLSHAPARRLAHRSPALLAPASAVSATTSVNSAGTTSGTKVEELLQKILDAILNSGVGGKSGLSPYDILAAFNHLVEAAQIQRNRGTRAGYVQ